MVLSIPVVYDPAEMARRRGAYNLSEPEPGTLGFFIRQRRDELGLTQQELADLIVDLGGKMTQGDVSDLESPSGTKLPRPPRMRLLSQALRVSIGRLYKEAGYPDLAGINEGEAMPLGTIEVLPSGPDGEIIALVRRIPKHRRRQAIDILKIMADEEIET
jgi:transcriptional regulator with XRE-family HTH domain